MRRKLFALITTVLFITNVLGEENTENIMVHITNKANDMINESKTAISENVTTYIKKLKDSIKITLESEKEEITVSEEEMKVHFLDVGQGDSALVVHGEHALLIDAGENDKGTKIQAYMEKQGIGEEISLDYVIGTHGDSDHVGGLDVVITKFDCENILLPNTDKNTDSYADVLDAITYRNYTITNPKPGESYSLSDEVSFTIIAPNEYYAEENNRSIGFVLQHGENRFLFMGDAEEISENDTINKGWNIQADVYKVNHHGSKSSSSERFLDAVEPTYAVISCGEGNDYGHPHATTLNQLRAKNVKVFRTDEQGTIIATSDGTKITWNVPESDSWMSGE